MLLLLFFVCWFSSSELRKHAVRFLTEKHSLIMYYEILGVVSFCFCLLIRSFSPGIYGAEKYMDLGILNTLIRSRQLPPLDPWLAGFPVHYYYYGHLFFATLGKMSLIPSQYIYNYSLATLFLLSMLGAASLGYNISNFKFQVPCSKLNDNKKKEVDDRMAGLLTAFFLCLAGNMDGFFQFLQKRSLFQIDYWQSSRIIPATINEFPFFSFLHGDLHAHLINLPVILVLLSTVFVLYIQKNHPIDFMIWLTLILGTAIAVNPWDMIPISLLLLITCFNTGWKTTVWILITLFVGIGLFSPYFITLPHSSQGIGKVTTVTRVTEFLMIFGLPVYLFISFIFTKLAELNYAKNNKEGYASGMERSGFPDAFYISGLLFLSMVIGVATKNLLLGFLCILMLCNLCGLFYFHKNSPSLSFILTLTMVSFIIFIGCEMVYLKDPYVGSLYRMNTVFKGYFTAWTLLAISAGYFAIYLMKKGNRHFMPSLIWQGGLVTLIIMSLAYPIGATYTRSLGFRHLPTLNGWAYLKQSHPFDLEGIQWLQENVTGSPVILEYSGDPYTYSSRVSSNTGLPTILGWANHELVWRNDSNLLEERQQDVDTLFNTTDILSTKLLLDKYHVQYIIVGELEKEIYSSDKLVKWATLGKIAYSNEQITIYQYQ